MLQRPAVQAGSSSLSRLCHLTTNLNMDAAVPPLEHVAMRPVGTAVCLWCGMPVLTKARERCMSCHVWQALRGMRASKRSGPRTWQHGRKPSRGMGHSIISILYKRGGGLLAQEGLLKMNKKRACSAATIGKEGGRAGSGSGGGLTVTTGARLRWRAAACGEGGAASHGQGSTEEITGLSNKRVNLGSGTLLQLFLGAEDSDAA